MILDIMKTNSTLGSPHEKQKDTGSVSEPDSQGAKMKGFNRNK